MILRSDEQQTKTPKTCMGSNLPVPKDADEDEDNDSDKKECEYDPYGNVPRLKWRKHATSCNMGGGRGVLNKGVYDKDVCV